MRMTNILKKDKRNLLSMTLVCVPCPNVDDPGVGASMEQMWMC